MTFDAGAIEARLILDRARFKAELASARAEGDAFAAKTFTAKLDIDASRARMSMADTSAVYNALRARLSTPIKVTVDNAAANASILSTIGLLGTLNAKAGAALGTTGRAAGGGGGFGGGIFGVLGRAGGAKIPLFGGNLGLPGILAAVGGIHLLIDVATEFIAVIVPASIALATFGIAAVPTVQDIYTKMQQINTVVQATGKSIYPLSSGFQHMADAVRPEVYQLFGDALLIANQRGGAFQRLAVATGQTVDDLAARFTMAATNGKGFSIFMQNAVPDVSKLGDVVGNLGGTLGNLIKSTPQYAEALLSIADDGTKVLEWASRVSEPLVKAGLAFHGAFLYTGLLGTGLGLLVRGGLNLAAGALLGTGIRLERFGAFGAKAATAMGNLAGSAQGAASLPWGWIAIAAVGLGFLAYKLFTAKDATQQWIASINSATDAAPAFSGIGHLMLQQVEITTKLDAAQKALGISTKQAVASYNQYGAPIRRVKGDVYGQEQAIAELYKGQQAAIAQTKLFVTRLNELGSTYGSNRQAVALLELAHVKLGDITSKDANVWARVKLEVAAVALGYETMGQRAGTLGSDLNALTLAGSDQITKMGQLNQAWDTWISLISGGQNSLLTFQQDILSVNQSFTGIGGTGRTVTGTFSAINAAAHASGATMNGINAQSLQLRSTWQSAFGAGSQLIDALRLQASVSPGGFPSVTKAVRDVVAQLSLFGKQGRASRGELISLAQEVDPNITNFKQLTAWLGNTKNAGENLNKLVSRMGINIDNLTEDAKALSNTLQADVIAQFQSTLLHASGTSKAVEQLATDLANQGSRSEAVRQDRLNLIRDLESMGLSARDATSLIAAMITETTRIPRHAEFSIGVQATGTWSVSSGGGGTPVGTPGGGHVRGPGQGARGMFFSQGKPGIDDQLILAQRGELLVPTRMVAAGLVDHLRGHIPGFAGGGVVGGYRGTAPGVGRFLINEDSATVRMIENATARATVAGILGARQAYFAPGGLGRASLRQIENWWMGAGGPGGIVAHMAAAITGAESGFNPGAVQQGQPYATTGWGLWQITPGNSEPQFGIDRALLNPVNNAGAAVAKFSGAGGFSPWTTFMNGAYLRFMDHGGGLRPGTTLVSNRTGRVETVTPAHTMEEMVDGIDEVADLLSKVLSVLDSLPPRMAGNLSSALNGIARRH